MRQTVGMHVQGLILGICFRFKQVWSTSARDPDWYQILLLHDKLGNLESVLLCKNVSTTCNIHLLKYLTKEEKKLTKRRLTNFLITYKDK